MQTYLPEWLRRALAPAPGSGRKRGGRAAARWDDEEEEEEEEEEDSEEEVEDEASSSSGGEAGARGSRAAQASGAVGCKGCGRVPAGRPLLQPDALLGHGWLHGMTSGSACLLQVASMRSVRSHPCLPALLGALQELEPYRTVLRDGRVKYERLAHFYCDPWQIVKPLENRVQSCMTVEVVPVRRGG